MVRPQDILFGILAVVVAGFMAFHFEVVVMALVGAFACGALYVFKGMIPSPQESFWSRIFTSVFLSIVLASLVLILPGAGPGRSANGHGHCRRTALDGHLL
jgi:hypothetical protein